MIMDFQDIINVALSITKHDPTFEMLLSYKNLNNKISSINEIILNIFVTELKAWGKYHIKLMCKIQLL